MNGPHRLTEEANRALLALNTRLKEGAPIEPASLQKLRDEALTFVRDFDRRLNRTGLRVAEDLDYLSHRISGGKISLQVVKNARAAADRFILAYDEEATKPR